MKERKKAKKLRKERVAEVQRDREEPADENIVQLDTSTQQSHAVSKESYGRVLLRQFHTTGTLIVVQKTLSNLRTEWVV